VAVLTGIVDQGQGEGYKGSSFAGPTRNNQGEQPWPGDFTPARRRPCSLPPRQSALASSSHSHTLTSPGGYDVPVQFQPHLRFDFV
jgi:hypothetical protein